MVYSHTGNIIAASIFTVSVFWSNNMTPANHVVWQVRETDAMHWSNELERISNVLELYYTLNGKEAKELRQLAQDIRTATYDNSLPFFGWEEQK